MRDVAAVRGLNSQRDIFRGLKLIIQSPVRGARVYNISPGETKQEIHAKASLNTFFLSQYIILEYGPHP